MWFAAGNGSGGCGIFVYVGCGILGAGCQTESGALCQISEEDRSSRKSSVCCVDESIWTMFVKTGRPSQNEPLDAQAGLNGACTTVEHSGRRQAVRLERGCMVFGHIRRSLHRSAHCPMIEGTVPIHEWFVRLFPRFPTFQFGPDQSSSGSWEVGWISET